LFFLKIKFIRKKKTERKEIIIMSRAGRSKDSIHNAIQYTVPVAIQIGISLIPGIGQVFDVLQAISIFVDEFIDPSNYKNTLTRDGINTICNDLTVAMKKAINEDVNYIAAVKKTITDVSPTITPAQLERETAIVTAWYKKKLIYAPVSCYKDLVDPNATGILLDVSMSGEPTTNCPDIYSAPYNAFVDENKAKYEAAKITNSNFIIEAANAGTTLAARNKIKSDRDVYTVQFTIVGIISFISLIVILTLFLKQRKKERQKLN
jgi:hypothetical protein